MNVTERITVGLKREERGVSDEAHSARALGSGLLPVLATPAMTALMEQAAAGALEEFLPEGWTSVGISLDVEHTSATPLGMGFRAEAEVMAVEGRKILFDVRAYDDAGEIGHGTHARFAVESEPFLAKAAKKRG
ncbi:MAG: dihydrolipoamide acyltransferase [Schwartzia succinivorans]|nr:dihydrolipoamide acyltransferase [Schwartzia succinivorans]